MRASPVSVYLPYTRKGIVTREATKLVNSSHPSPHGEQAPPRHLLEKKRQRLSEVEIDLPECPLFDACQGYNHTFNCIIYNSKLGRVILGLREAAGGQHLRPILHVTSDER